MKIRIFKPRQEVIILLWLLWQQPMAGRPSGCSLVKNFVVKYPHALEAEERCWPCPKCPIGQGLAPQCGSIISNSTKIECTPCEVNKTYSDSHGIGSCSPCNQCGLKNILQPCTPDQNRKCGKDCPKGFFLNDNEDCQAEATSMPIIGTKTTVASDHVVHNITSEHLKTTQVYNATAGLSAKNSSDGEMTATSSVPIRKWEIPPSKNNIADDLQRNKDKEPQTVDQTTFIVVVSLLLAVIIFEAIVIAFCREKRSRSERAEFRGAAGENIPLSSPDLDSEGSTQVEDISVKEEATPNVEKIPAEYTISDIESLCDDNNQPVLFFVKRELDPMETITRKTWRSVGQALKVSIKDLDLIETEYKTGRSPTEVLIAKLKTFTKEPTLREFVQALITCERNDVASYICNCMLEKTSE